MIHDVDPPVLLRDVLDDPGAAVRLLERNAPYTPLGGWYRPGADLDAPTSPLWFQNDFVHANLQVEVAGGAFRYWPEGPDKPPRGRRW